MGVPSFFRWLTSKFPHSVRMAAASTGDPSQPNANGVEYDNLYLDLNGIIHPCCHPEGCEAPPTEELMIEAVFKVIDHVFNIARPRKLLFVAIDGVAPRAKMNQQRSRRFRAVRDSKEHRADEDSLREDLGLPVLERGGRGWDSNAITPGTPFMEKLASGVRHFLASRVESDPAWSAIKVIFSPSSTPGEGEHKIMDYIRRQRHAPGYDPRTRHVVYGLDADLIMLALASHEPNFTLLREDRPLPPRYQRHMCTNCKKYGHTEKECPRLSGATTMDKMDYVLLDISIVREMLDQMMHCDLPFTYDLERIIDDFVCLCIFAGNDFLPHLPTLSIHDGALDALLMAYRCALPTLGGYMTLDGRLSIRRVQRVLRAVASWEDYMVAHRRKMLPRCGANTAPSWILRATTQPTILRAGEAPESRPWHRAYYQVKFGDDVDVAKNSSELAMAYMQGVWWTMRYYTQGCPSWTWFYPYHYAPFACDLADSINPKDFTDSVAAIVPGVPFKPLQQLLAVLPPASANCLPEAMRPLMQADSPIADFYPETYELDRNDEFADYKAICLLPWIDEKRLLEASATYEANLPEEERSTNTVRDLLLCNEEKHPALAQLLRGVEEAQRAGFAKKITIEAHGIEGTAAVMPRNWLLSVKGELQWEGLANVGPRPKHVAAGAFRSPRYDADFVFPSAVLPGALSSAHLFSGDVGNHLWWLSKPRCLGQAYEHYAAAELNKLGITPSEPPKALKLGTWALDRVLRNRRANAASNDAAAPVLKAPKILEIQEEQCEEANETKKRQRDEEEEMLLAAFDNPTPEEEKPTPQDKSANVGANTKKVVKIVSSKAKEEPKIVKASNPDGKLPKQKKQRV